MGGDYGSQVVLSGAALALRAMPELYLLLVGNQAEIEPALTGYGIHGDLLSRVKIVHADSVVTMGDKATSILKDKKTSSVRVAAECVRDGNAQGMVSMGHTGAAMVASMKVIGTLPGVYRPCLATVLPTFEGTPTVLLDVGANVDCKPEHLAQFALMGAVYAEKVLGIPEPRIGVLSVGEEDGKGSETTRHALDALRVLDINFGGNAEGRDIWNGKFNVVACDGFVGNVVLKSSEALAEGVFNGMKNTLRSNLLSRIGGLLVRPSMRSFYKKLDYAEYGGAPLLGIKGISIIGHGRSNARAVYSAVRAAARGAKNNINDRIQERMLHLLQTSQETETA
jgi:glycerol-3-phosphate acyltransferase PlsX